MLGGADDELNPQPGDLEDGKGFGHPVAFAAVHDLVVGDTWNGCDDADAAGVFELDAVDDPDVSAQDHQVLEIGMGSVGAEVNGGGGFEGGLDDGHVLGVFLPSASDDGGKLGNEPFVAIVSVEVVDKFGSELDGVYVIAVVGRGDYPRWKV